MLGTERILGRPNVRQLITVVFCATAVLLSASAPNKRGCAVKQRGGECRVSCCDCALVRIPDGVAIVLGCQVLRAWDSRMSVSTRVADRSEGRAPPFQFQSLPYLHVQLQPRPPHACFALSLRRAPGVSLCLPPLSCHAT